MALAWPQGECFFKRSALQSGAVNTVARFTAEDPKLFYSTMVVEMVWNKEAHHGSEACKENSNPKGHPHKRSGYTIVTGGRGWKTSYGNWTHLPFSYGAYYQPSRQIQHELCTDGERFKKREHGDAYESWFMFVPLPTRHEEWVFIDRLCSIRAIYIPVSYMASEKSEDLCTYIHVRFNGMKDIALEYHKDKTPEKFAEIFDFETVEKTTATLTCHDTFGIEHDETTAIGINITKLVTTLILPRQFRKYDAFSSKAIILVDTSLIPVIPVLSRFTASAMADWATVASKNHGVSVKWAEGDHSPHWLLSFLKNTLVVCAGLVPGIGPLLSMGSALLMEALINPDGMLEEFKEQLPGLGEMFDEIFDLSKECRKGMAVKMDIASPTQAVTVDTNSDDAVLKTPVQADEPEQEEKKSTATYVNIPSYTALSKAEYDATVGRQLREALGRKLGGLAVEDRGISREQAKAFQELVTNPPKEHQDKTVDELFEVVESKYVRDRLKAMRTSLFTKKMEEDFRASETESIKKRLLTEATPDSSSRLADNFYEWAENASRKIAMRDNPMLAFGGGPR
ncbi:hypothetical protein MGYG_07471 [Nannizzia gypsea CBS 118893]|uniref:Uncharacterized protein n=1 Tax=Arthroderma gypseum (strain ATCC MYA-4604 / CBS 118893) TaxID=535722 RepID=E4V389_ARTGP|nr:hypothetical protein MGYG_07471 [Nannizzia gypsea CBS 118893]EFR04463.1 hypothetical protein MGYG_07471 [Nannizzia gypsea CBS 118893]